MFFGEKDERTRLFGIPQFVSRYGNAARRFLLELNRKHRENPELTRHDLDIGFAALQIPELDFYVLKWRYPDIASPDVGIRTVAWKKLLREPFMEKYKVNKRDGFKKRRA